MLTELSLVLPEISYFLSLSINEAHCHLLLVSGNTPDSIVNKPQLEIISVLEHPNHLWKNLD